MLSVLGSHWSDYEPPVAASCITLQQVLLGDASTCAQVTEVLLAL